MLVFITAFEVLVGFLQAYIFTILACVFIASSMVSHEEHEEHEEHAEHPEPVAKHAEAVA
jgi:hypothetical protein